jgi:hypothetical protein
MASTSDWIAKQNERITNRDARVRGLRSLMWGLLIDVSVAVVLVLVTAFTSIEWTALYWSALGLTLSKTILQAIVAFFARKLLPPSGTANL